MADRRLIDDINRVVSHPPKPRDRLAPAGSPGALPGRGTGKPGGPGAGIASPLTEPDVNQRKYHPEQVYPSTDGVFWLGIEPIAKLVLKDANGAEVVIFYASDPPPPPPPSTPVP